MNLQQFFKVEHITAEKAFREFVLSNPDHELAGSAQYWYAETFESDNYILMRLLLVESYQNILKEKLQLIY